jgi:hypothetical protein
MSAVSPALSIPSPPLMATFAALSTPYPDGAEKRWDRMDGEREENEDE